MNPVQSPKPPIPGIAAPLLPRVHEADEARPSVSLTLGFPPAARSPSSAPVLLSGLTPPNAHRASPRWVGPVVTADQIRDFKEEDEQQVLKASGKKMVLAAYEGFDPSKPPVVLVHGYTGTGYAFSDLAVSLHAAGHQVLFALFDDVHQRLPRSGQQLADEVANLRRFYAESPDMVFVGHSMGGLLSLAAVNSLHNPGWMRGEIGASGYRDEVGQIRVFTVDSPFGGVRQWIPRYAWITRLGLALGLGGGDRGDDGMAVHDMGRNSKFIERLFSVEHDRTTFANLMARHPEAPNSSVLTLDDLDVEQASQLVADIALGIEPRDLTSRNMARAIARDPRAKRLRLVLLRKLNVAETPAEMRQALIDSYDEVVGRYDGTHVDILTGDDTDAPTPLVRALTRALREGRAVPVRRVRD